MLDAVWRLDSREPRPEGPSAMAVVRRGVKNASRNLIRSVSVVAILALAISLAVVMLLSRQAVEGRIEQVKGEVGTTRHGDAGRKPWLRRRRRAAHRRADVHDDLDAPRPVGHPDAHRPGAHRGIDLVRPARRRHPELERHDEPVSSIDAGALGRRFGGGGDGTTGGGTGGGHRQRRQRGERWIDAARSRCRSRSPARPTRPAPRCRGGHADHHRRHRARRQRRRQGRAGRHGARHQEQPRRSARPSPPTARPITVVGIYDAGEHVRQRRHHHAAADPAGPVRPGRGRHQRAGEGRLDLQRRPPRRPRCRARSARRPTWCPTRAARPTRCPPSTA